MHAYLLHSILTYFTSPIMLISFRNSWCLTSPVCCLVACYLPTGWALTTTPWFNSPSKRASEPKPPPKLLVLPPELVLIGQGTGMMFSLQELLLCAVVMVITVMETHARTHAHARTPCIYQFTSLRSLTLSPLMNGLVKADTL